MLFKKPNQSSKRWLKKGILGIIVAETIFFASGFIAWHAVNTKRDVRKYLNDHFPQALELYYQVGEKYDSDLKRIRELDQAYWQNDSS